MQTDIVVIIIYHLGQTSTGGKYMKLEVTNIDSLFTYSEICDIQAKRREEVVSTDQIVVPCRRRWCSTATSVLRRRGAPSTDGPPRQTRAVAQLPLAPVASTSRRQRAQPPASIDLLDARVCSTLATSRL